MPEEKSRSDVRFIAALFFVSTGAALFAVAFRAAFTLLFDHVYHAKNVLEAFHAMSWPAKLFATTLGGLGAGCCTYILTRTKKSGSVGEVMEAVVLGRGRISISATLLKALGSWMAMAGGGSIGREGPLIQVGGSLGSAIARGFNLEGSRARALVAAGAAAGFAAAYNTPFAAVLFMIEVVTGVVALDVLLPSALAVAIATAVTRALVGGGPIYGQRAFAIASPIELGWYAVIGLGSGLIGVAFMTLLAFGERSFARLPLRQPLQAAVGAALVGAIAIVLPEVTGNGYEAINSILDARLALGTILVLLVAKAVATTASVGSGAPGGVFTPSLLLGACFGAALAMSSSGNSGAFALVGMAAVCAATTHAPLMASVMVFELSGDYAIVLPLIVATSIATIVSRRLRSDSLYAAELRQRGLIWEDSVGSRRIVGLGEPSVMR